MEWLPFILIGLIISLIVNVICIQELDDRRLASLKIDENMWLVLLRIRIWLEYLDVQRGIIKDINPLNFNKLPLEKHSFDNIDGSFLKYFMKSLQDVSLYNLNKGIIQQLEIHSLKNQKLIQEASTVMIQVIKEIQRNEVQNEKIT